MKLFKTECVRITKPVKAYPKQEPADLSQPIAHRHWPESPGNHPVVDVNAKEIEGAVAKRPQGPRTALWWLTRLVAFTKHSQNVAKGKHCA